MQQLDIFLLILNKSGIPRQIFKEVSNTKFHVNPSSGSRADTRVQMAAQSDRRTHNDPDEITS